MTATLTPDQLDAAHEAWEHAAHGLGRCICGSLRDVVAGDSDRFGLTLCTLRCRECGTLRSERVIEDWYLPIFYRDLYPAMHPGLEHDRAEREARQAKWIGERYDVSGRVIEIGGKCLAGAGSLAYRSLDVAGDNEPPRERADLLVALHVLEHCTDPVATLREWAGYLDYGGQMAVVVPNILEVHHHRHVQAMGLRGWWQIAHAWNWAPQNVTLPFVKAGLMVRQWNKAAPGTLATVGSLVVTARKDRALAEYLEERGGSR